MEQNDLQILYPQEIEPNGMVTITNNAELSTIERWIQDSLVRGVDIYIMSPRHQSCDVNPQLFSKLISNEDDLIKVIFLSDEMIEYMEILEEFYHSDEWTPLIMKISFGNALFAIYYLEICDRLLPRSAYFI